MPSSLPVLFFFEWLVGRDCLPPVGVVIVAGIDDPGPPSVGRDCLPPVGVVIVAGIADPGPPSVGRDCIRRLG
jgi:hypothetical protein